MWRRVSARACTGPADECVRCGNGSNQAIRSGLHMELTWIAIAASLLMGGGALLIFVWAVRSHQFHSFEDVKYQVFWSDQASAATKKTAKGERKDGRDGNANQA